MRQHNPEQIFIRYLSCSLISNEVRGGGEPPVGFRRGRRGADGDGDSFAWSTWRRRSFIFRVKEFSFAFGDDILSRFVAANAFVATVSSTTALWLSSYRLLKFGYIFNNTVLYRYIRGLQFLYIFKISIGIKRRIINIGGKIGFLPSTGTNCVKIAPYFANIYQSLILDRCRAFDLFESVDAHLCLRQDLVECWHTVTICTVYAIFHWQPCW
jgi:hypothetical protein